MSYFTTLILNDTSACLFDFTNLNRILFKKSIEKHIRAIFHFRYSNWEQKIKYLRNMYKKIQRRFRHKFKIKLRDTYSKNAFALTIKQQH